MIPQLGRTGYIFFFVFGNTNRWLYSVLVTSEDWSHACLSHYHMCCQSKYISHIISEFTNHWQDWSKDATFQLEGIRGLLYNMVNTVDNTLHS